MNRATGLQLVAALGLSSLAACAPSSAIRPGAIDLANTAAASPGYLDDIAYARLGETVPPPPVAGSPVELADRATLERYRVLEDGDRWLLATAHAELRPAYALPHFDCALGTRLGAAPTPRLAAVFEKLLHDADEAAELVKARAFRARPVGDDPDRRSCQRLSAAGRAGPSYPSGSATVAAVYGEAMAVLAPDRAEAVRATAHQIAISRVVCAMHYPSDVAAGETLGRAVFAEVAASPHFQGDLDAARAELTAARAMDLTNPGCAAERAALATPPP